MSDISLRLSLESVLEISIRINSLLDCLLSVLLPVQFLISSLHKLIVFPWPEFTRSDIAGILPESFSSHRSIENFNRLQAETRSYFDKSQLLFFILLCEFLFMLVHNLVNTEPYSVIKVVKTEHMIYERLWLGVIFRCIKSLVQHFLNELKMGFWIERAIKR